MKAPCRGLPTESSHLTPFVVHGVFLMHLWRHLILALVLCVFRVKSTLHLRSMSVMVRRSLNHYYLSHVLFLLLFVVRIPKQSLQSQSLSCGLVTQRGMIWICWLQKRYTAITGNLVIKNIQIDAIDLPHLQSVDGDVFYRKQPHPNDHLHVTTTKER